MFVPFTEGRPAHVCWGATVVPQRTQVSGRHTNKKGVDGTPLLGSRVKAMQSLLLLVVLALPFALIGALIWLLIMTIGTPSRRQGA